MLTIVACTPGDSSPGDNDAVVVADAVDVIQHQTHRAPAPGRLLPAEFAPSLLQALRQETDLQPPPVACRALDEDLGKRNPPASRLDRNRSTGATA